MMSDINSAEEIRYQQTIANLSLTDEIVKAVTYEECTFESCSFISCRFEKCKFISCKFNDCILSAVVPMDCRFIEAEFNRCKTLGIDWTKTQLLREQVFKDCQLNYSSFKLLKTPRIKMINCEVKEADFTEADMRRGDFKNTDFEKSRFFKTNLSGADFKGARNYAIDPLNNTLKKTRFSYPEVLTLLNGLDIIIE
jgi:fluoroquinolone resistance protein